MRFPNWPSPHVLLCVVLAFFSQLDHGLCGEETQTLSQQDVSTRDSSQTKGASPVDSGRGIGEYVPTFYSRVVTGPLMNRSVCYVCRNGQRPVVMVFLREVGKESVPLLKQIDDLVDDHRAEGLRSFGVYVCDDPSEAVPVVQTFSFDNKLSLPLTVASTAIAEPHCQNIHVDADVTVVLYRNRKVVESFGYERGHVDRTQIQSIKTSIEKLLKARRTATADDAN